MMYVTRAFSHFERSLGISCSMGMKIGIIMLRSSPVFFNLRNMQTGESGLGGVCVHIIVGFRILRALKICTTTF